ncbi:MAG TPA: glycosyltransferase family 4 protein [Candidatus Obscuribacterales bacterium]
MIVLSHPTGNAFVRAVLLGIEQAGWLDSFHTTVAFDRSQPWIKLLPPPLRADCERRTYDVSPDKVVSHPVRELVRLVASRLGWELLARHESGWACADAVYRDLDRKVAAYVERHASSMSPSPGLSGVYCYEDGALETFRAALRRDLARFYDLPIAYCETTGKLLREEAERLPEWERTLGATRDSAAKLERKAEEIALADVVIVPSRFVYGSLPGEIKDSKRCVVAEFGSPAPDTTPLSHQPRNPARPLRLLFAGAMTQRKGLADVMAAVRMLNRSDVELVVMGSPLASMDFYRRQLPNFTYEPPRPHKGVLELMRTCDVLVLPSIVEGRALVQQEAMMCGLPVIVTPNAGAEDLVEDGKTGFLVPIRSPDVLAEKICWFADHRTEIDEMGRRARQKARQLTWDNYRMKILSEIRRVAGLSGS